MSMTNILVAQSVAAERESNLVRELTDAHRRSTKDEDAMGRRNARRLALQIYAHPARMA